MDNIFSCDWRLFAEKAKECLSCDNFLQCKKDRDIYTLRFLHNGFMTDGIVEEDAKMYAEFIREYEEATTDMDAELTSLYDEKLEEEKETQAQAKEFKRATASQRALAPFVDFFEEENIPNLFVEPNELYASYFMVIAYTKGGFTVRLSSIDGVPKDAKFMRQIYKSESNKRQYKYVKRDTFDNMLTLVKRIIVFRKYHGRQNQPSI